MTVLIIVGVILSASLALGCSTYALMANSFGAVGFAAAFLVLLIVQAIVLDTVLDKEWCSDGIVTHEIVVDDLSFTSQDSFCVRTVK